MDGFTGDLLFDTMRRNHTKMEAQSKRSLSWSIIQNYATGELVLYSNGNVDPELVKAALTPLEPIIGEQTK